MKKRLVCLLLIGMVVLSMMPNTVLAAMGNDNVPYTGDFSDMWIWIALAAVGLVGFCIVLFLLLAPKKKGKYQREEKKK